MLRSLSNTPSTMGHSIMDIERGKREPERGYAMCKMCRDSAKMLIDIEQ